MSKKRSFVKTRAFHWERSIAPERFHCSSVSSKTAYSEGFSSGVDYGRPLIGEVEYWKRVSRDYKRNCVGAYNLGVAAGKRAARKARK